MARGLIMNFKQAVSSGLGKYATLQGRAPRSEYWWFFLFGILAPCVAGLLDYLLFGYAYGVSSFYTLVQLGLLIPSITVGVRRFHDLGRSGWWMLIMLTGIGVLVTIIWFIFRGTEGPNRYGPDPLDTRPV